jgi:hypothetical protein
MIRDTCNMIMYFILCLQMFGKEVWGVKGLGEDGDVITTREYAEPTYRSGILNRVPGRLERCSF